ncbi:MAG: DNA polymerase III subunit beta [Patescibacteria group bacterium]|nr:DNA polymerase III subunit beta [Patescibacteria group bacterium]
MHFVCTQENLIQGLNMVGHVAGKNVNLPVLGNVLLKTENGALKLSSTNLEIAVSCLVRGKVEVEGEYSVPAKLFLDYVSLLPSGKVELVLIEDGLEVKSGDQETVLKGISAAEFPLLPKLAKDGGYSFSALDLKRALSQVVFAVSTSQSRPELMGVACFMDGGDASPAAVFVATDSYRLAERKQPFSGNGSGSRYIVPAKAFLEMMRILGAYKDELSAPENVTLNFTENQLVATLGSVDLISRLIEGFFPDYKQIIPQQFKTEAVLSRAELQKAVRAASLFSKQGLFDVHVSFDPEASTCTIESADQGTGKTKTVLKGEVKGVVNEVTLNFRFLGDGLAAMSGDKVRIKQIDSLNPVLVTPEGDDGYRYIVMPIRQ